MSPTELIPLAGAVLVPVVGAVWWAVRMSWQVARRDAMIDSLSAKVDALSARVSVHDDLRERLVRVETVLEAVHVSVERIGQRLDGQRDR